MNISLTGASVTSLAFFCHAINALPAVCPDTTPTCPSLHAMYLDQLQLADPCLQAKVREGSQSSAGNYAELDCNHHKEASLWWGLASFFAGAPQELHGSAALHAAGVLHESFTQ